MFGLWWGGCRALRRGGGSCCRAAGNKIPVKHTVIFQQVTHHPAGWPQLDTSTHSHIQPHAKLSQRTNPLQVSKWDSFQSKSITLTTSWWKPLYSSGSSGIMIEICCLQTESLLVCSCGHRLLWNDRILLTPIRFVLQPNQMPHDSWSVHEMVQMTFSCGKKPQQNSFKVTDLWHLEQPQGFCLHCLPKGSGMLQCQRVKGAQVRPCSCHRTVPGQALTPNKLL